MTFNVLSRNLKRLIDFVTFSMFFSLFIAIVLQVFGRYTGLFPTSGTEEIARISYLWVLTWGLAFQINIKEHVSFDLLYESVTPAFQLIFNFITYLSFAFLFVVSMRDNYDYFIFLDFQKTDVFDISYRALFLPYFIFVCVVPIKLVVELYAQFQKFTLQEQDQVVNQDSYHIEMEI